jgi:hypothetical protein
VAHLMGIDLDAARVMGQARHTGGAVTGAVRMSMGLDTTVDAVLALVDALLRIVKHGPQWAYQLSADTSTCVPLNDHRGEYVMPFDHLRKWTP